MSNRPLSAGSERQPHAGRTASRPQSAASRPQSATSRPPADRRAGEVVRVEYSSGQSNQTRLVDPYARPAADPRPTSAHSNVSIRSMSSVGSQHQLPPAPLISWGPGPPAPSPGGRPGGRSGDGAKAFKGLHHAMGESAWLDEKFRRTGAPEPADGELTVVIEYCWNGEEPQRQQMSTANDLKRYHQEAMLTAAYIRRFCPTAVVATIPSNFRGERQKQPRDGVPKRITQRLGAFEVDARMRIDGELQQYNLWSKLHSQKWPQWPGWQDTIRQALPVFKLLLRPVAVLADGSEAPIPDARLTLLNWDRSRTVLTQVVSSGGSCAVKLLRGSYIVCVDETAESYAEEATLTLTRVRM